MPTLAFLAKNAKFCSLKYTHVLHAPNGLDTVESYCRNSPVRSCIAYIRLSQTSLTHSQKLENVEDLFLRDLSFESRNKCNRKLHCQNVCDS